MTLRSAVVLFVYNRKTYLPAILERIRAAHPTKLYVFGHGPKKDPEDHATPRFAAISPNWLAHLFQEIPLLFDLKRAPCDLPEPIAKTHFVQIVN